VIEDVVPDGGIAGSSSSARAPAGSGGLSVASRKTSSPGGGCSSSAWPGDGRSCWCSRIPVGGREPARLHRVPAGVVQEPSGLRRDPRAARAPGAPANLGGLSTRLDLPVAGTSHGRGDGPDAQGHGSGSVGRAPGADPGTGRRVPSTRWRRFDAADRGLLRREGDRFEPTGPSTSSLVPETLHAPIASRLTALRPRSARCCRMRPSSARPSRRWHLDAVRSRRGRARPILSSLVRRSSSACRPTCVRPSAASTASCIARPEGGLRDPLAAGPQGTPPRRDRLPRAGLVGR
jgi:hypothetical protein